MNKIAVLVTALLVATALSAPSAPAAETGASASLGLYSHYVWRGLTLSEGAVIQPAAGLTWNGLGMNVWSNYDIDSRQLNETDVTLNYAGAWEKLGYEMGAIYYGLDGMEDTTELYLSLNYDVLLSPKATFYWDVDEGDGGFLVLAIGHSFPVTDAVGIDLGADVSVNFDNAVLGAGEDGEAFTGFYNADISVGTSIPFATDWALDLLLAYSIALGNDGKTAISGLSFDGEKNVLWGGAAISLHF